MKNMGRIINITELYNQVQITVFDWNTKMEKNYIQKKSYWQVGDIVRFNDQFILHKIFTLPNCEVEDGLEITNWISELTKEELIKIHQKICLLKKNYKFKQNVPNIFITKALNVYEMGMNQKNLYYFFCSEYISEYMKYRIKLEFKINHNQEVNLSEKMKEFLESKDKQLKNQSIKIFHEIMQNLKPNETLIKDDDTMQNETLYMQLMRLIYHWKTSKKQKYLDQFANQTDLMKCLLGDVKNFCTVYTNNEISYSNLIQRYLEQIFLRLHQLNPEKSYAMVQAVKKLNGFPLHGFPNAFLYLAEVNYDLKKWEQMKLQMRFNANLKEIKKEHFSFQQFLNERNTYEILVGFLDFVDQIYELNKEENNIIRKKS